MLKAVLGIILILNTTLAVQAFEDCIISTNGKLTDISIENNNIVDVYPLVTISNDKNTLIVHPLSVGKTRFCVLKNNKNIVMFNIEVKENETLIEDVEGFDILTIDIPQEELEIDYPPEISGENNG